MVKMREGRRGILPFFQTFLHFFLSLVLLFLL